MDSVEILSRFQESPGSEPESSLMILQQKESKFRRNLLCLQKA
jgi:hypothetical protein